MRWGASFVLALGLVSGAAHAEPVHTLDLSQHFGESPGTTEGRRAVYDTLTVATSLQGIVNRDAPNLYLFYVRSVVDGSIDTDALWFERLGTPEVGGGVLDDREIVALDDLDAALDAYGDRVQGLAVWDPAVPATVNGAFVAAGAQDLLVVAYSDDPSSLYVQLQDRFDVVVSLVGAGGASVFLDDQGNANVYETARQTSQSAKADVYVWALENYAKPGSLDPLEFGYMLDGTWVGDPTDYNGNPQATHQLQITNRDWLVAKRGFPFDLSPWDDVPATDDPGQPVGTDPAVLREMMSTARSQAPADVITIRGFFGWQFKYTTLEGLPAGHEPVLGEWTSVRLMSPWTVGLDADAPGVATVANASFHAHVPLDPLPSQQPRPTAEDLIGAGFMRGLADNGGFEDGAEGWSLATTNRAVYTDDLEGEPNAHGGLRYLQCNTADPADDAQNRIGREGPAVGAGTRVTMRAFVRASAPAQARLVVTAVGGTTETAEVTADLTTQWQEVRVELDVEGGGHSATRGEIVLETAGVNVDVDDVAFYAGDPRDAAVVPANYVLWFVGDYDGTAWLASFTPVTWDGPGRGVVPLAWDFSGHLASRFPPFFRHALASRTARDFFIGADSGPGYGNPSLFDAAGREIWATAGMRAHRRLDTSTTWVLNPLDPIDATGFEAVTPFAGDGIVFTGSTPLSLPTIVDGTPILRLDSAGGSDPASVEASVVDQLVAPAQPSFHAFRTVVTPTAATAGGSIAVVTDHPELRARFVGPYALFALLEHQLGDPIEKRASYMAVDGLSPPPDAPSTLVVTVRNDGWETWTPGTHRLGAHLFDDEVRARELPAAAGSYPIRVDLPEPVAPGAEVTLEVPLPALAPGTTQHLQLDMVEEGVAWFESRGDIPLQVAVTPVLEDDGGDTGGGDSTSGGELTSGGPGSSGSEGVSTSAAGMDDTGTGSGGASEAGDDGCGCTQGSAPPLWLGLLLLGFRRRRSASA